MNPEFVVLVPFVLGIVQACKIAGLSSRYAPIISLALGISVGVGMGQFDFDGVMQGIAVGLSASGLWSGGKAILSEDRYL